MNLDRLTELRKRKIGRFNILLTFWVSQKAHMPATSQATAGLRLRHLPCWLTSLTQPAMNFWAARNKSRLLLRPLN